jgi:hypothetical protein
MIVLDLSLDILATLFFFNFEILFIYYTSIHTYHSRFIPEEVAEVSQKLLQDTHVLSKLVSYEEHCRRER